LISKFSADKLEKLKENNDWNGELDINKFIKIPIDRRVEMKGVVSNILLTKAYQETLGDDANPQPLRNLCIH